MSSCFGSVEEATGYALAMLGIKPSDGITLEEVEDSVPVMGVFSDVLLDMADAEDATESDKAIAESIRSTMGTQQTFRFMKNGEEYELPLREPVNGQTTAKFKITIGPFRDGFDCWLVLPNGMAHRF